MCTEKMEADRDRAGMPVARRSFAALASAGALLAALPVGAMGTRAIAGREVSVAAPDGSIDAYFASPKEGKHPGVLIWPDIRGLRPAFRLMADRLASDGYAVLCVNPFYRWEKSPVVTAASDWGDPAVREKLFGYRRQMDIGTTQRDASALIPFLDAQPEVDANRKLGVTGYCMGGPMTIWTAAQAPARIGAAASFHGGGTATDGADSPHLLIPSTGAGYLFAIAEDDDAKDPEEKNLLAAILKPRPQWHEVEVYPAQHGWCPPDGRVYDETAAEKAWSRMLALFEAELG